jgi:hypothetical protein
MKKTIAEQLGVTEFPFYITDKRGDLIYLEFENNYWERRELDSRGNQIYYENSYGHWSKMKWDNNGNRTYYESSDGFWQTWEMDEAGEVIYSENSIGKIIDNRPNPEPEEEPKPIIETQTFAQQLNVKDFPFVAKDGKGNDVYYEDSEGYWSRREFDSEGNQIYFENSYGVVIKNQLKETNQQGTIQIDGKKYKLTEI